MTAPIWLRCTAVLLALACDRAAGEEYPRRPERGGR
jgi:hypothetical protein